jgi:hypothetical protein
MTGHTFDLILVFLVLAATVIALTQATRRLLIWRKAHGTIVFNDASGLLRLIEIEVPLSSGESFRFKVWRPRFRPLQVGDSVQVLVSPNKKQADLRNRFISEVQFHCSLVLGASYLTYLVLNRS